MIWFSGVIPILISAAARATTEQEVRASSGVPTAVTVDIRLETFLSFSKLGLKSSNSCLIIKLKSL